MFASLKSGESVVFDVEDLSVFLKYNWHFHHQGYAFTRIRRNGVRHVLWLHRLINKTPTGLQTDHINGDRLDNRKCNLRTVTGAENQRNRLKNKRSSSSFKGVSWIKRFRKWKAQIRVTTNNQSIKKFLGYYPTETLAAQAYNSAALKYFGAFAKTNQL
jgi:hypothetical protein